MVAGREFEVELEEIAREDLYDQVAFRLPAEAVLEPGITWVTGTINGRPFEANTGPEEAGTRLVFVPLEVRRELGIGSRDRVRVVLDAPDERPEVSTPDDLRDALAGAGAGLDFERLTAGQRREYARWIEDAQGAERAQRLRRAVEGIRERRAPGEVMRGTTPT